VYTVFFAGSEHIHMKASIFTNDLLQQKKNNKFTEYLQCCFNAAKEIMVQIQFKDPIQNFHKRIHQPVNTPTSFATQNIVCTLLKFVYI